MLLILNMNVQTSKTDNCNCDSIHGFEVVAAITGLLGDNLRRSLSNWIIIVLLNEIITF